MSLSCQAEYFVCSQQMTANTLLHSITAVAGFYLPLAPGKLLENADKLEAKHWPPDPALRAATLPGTSFLCRAPGNNGGGKV